VTAAALVLAAGAAASETARFLEVVAFFAGVAAALMLTVAMVLRSVPVRTLTTGQLLSQAGFVALSLAIAYEAGERLWGWYDLQLWLLAIAMVWSAVGCGYLLIEALQDRRADTSTIRGR
jgi:hypothetical protein